MGGTMTLRFHHMVTWGITSLNIALFCQWFIDQVFSECLLCSGHCLGAEIVKKKKKKEWDFVLKVFKDLFLFSTPVIACVECYNVGMKKIEEGELRRIDGRDSIWAGSCPWLGINQGMGSKIRKVSWWRLGRTWMNSILDWLKYKVIMEHQSAHV